MTTIATPPKSVSKLFAIALILGVFALDQLSKFYVVTQLRLPELGRIEISPFFDFTMVWNYGVSFGALRADAQWERWALVALSGIISIVFVVWLWRATRGLTTLALALVVGGSIGNMTDRIRFGAVADFLDFSALHFPWVFNVADAAITLGAVLLALDMLLNPEEPPQSQQKDQPQ